MKLFASFLTVAASECFSNWGESTTGCFPQDITWECTPSGINLVGSLSALYENSHLLTAEQKLGAVTVVDTHQQGDDSAVTKDFTFDENGDIKIELTWDSLAANPVWVPDTDEIRFSASFSPAEPIVDSSKLFYNIKCSKNMCSICFYEINYNLQKCIGRELTLLQFNVIFQLA